MEVIELKYKPLSVDENFYEFCSENDELKIERGSDGTIYVGLGSGGTTGMLNATISYWLMHWDLSSNLGHVFDSSTTFCLPNSSIRSPSASWLSSDNWNALNEAEKAKFPPICPDFVIELLSPHDELKTIQKKVQEEWIGNGCHLAWLIDPDTETAYVYRSNGEVDTIKGFDQQLSGENVLPGFEFDLSELKI
ncbi:Endonuclease, Uma2 family (restriction endonuclease fold) [Dyadobacter soli]|uniref:Endonuclease, Uma2 family (Restriction endonuclease fold) n=1 Tax=Dyadobacter soli TaxID=659014 RepID=A0A1G7QI39_9BACT|nr:Uma2 family endonuclease [Dyadobacter soli]SDF98227.1 Endonuclease, Uma2 family (restriction endonuclease fold) [Dyadobacter soli]